MPARLDPEERERRRKERVRRSFSDAAYKHYNPRTEGFGSADEWTDTAQERINAQPKKVVVVSAELQLLGLTEMPKTRHELLRAYRKRAMVVHPDRGGSNAAMIALTDAYETLKKRLPA